MTIDLGPAARQMAALVRGVDPGLLDAPTPCPDYSVGDLLDHIDGLALAFTWAATKESLAMPDRAPSGDASQLGDDWPERIPSRVIALAAAWDDPAAWTGMTKAGPVELPGEVGGLVALDEIVIHGWDLARATSQPYEIDDTTLDAVRTFVAQFSGPDAGDQRGGLFGPELAIPDSAPLLDRVLGMTGRNPAWTP